MKNIFYRFILLSISCLLFVSCGDNDIAEKENLGGGLGVSYETYPGLLKQTGLINSYLAYDDGWYKAGMGRGYTRERNRENTVLDIITGLSWQDDASTESIFLNWTDAIGYCDSLTLGGYSDWRLPSIAELRTIVNVGRYDSAIDDWVFAHTSSSDYWSTTTDVSNSALAWKVDFFNGSIYVQWKLYPNNVRCVRGDFTEPALERSDLTNIVVDTLAKTMWQDDEASASVTTNWFGAITYCERLGLGGYGDWRLPNRNELFSIADMTRSELAIAQAFQNTAQSYWTSTTYNLYVGSAWVSRFSSMPEGLGADDYNDKRSGHNNVRCVRSLLDQ